MSGAMKWITTWVVMISLLFILAGTSWGSGIVYYALWLMVALLMVTHADDLTSLIDVKSLALNG